MWVLGVPYHTENAPVSIIPDWGGICSSAARRSGVAPYGVARCDHISSGIIGISDISHTPERSRV